MILLEGRKVAEGIRVRLNQAIDAYSIKPHLAIIQIGNDERSSIYIKHKKSFGESIGARVRHIHLKEAAYQEEVLKIITDLNQDNDVDGIILQLPIPSHMDKERLLKEIDKHKDIDGLSCETPIYTPATARGVMTLLKAYHIDPSGKKAVVIGKSRLVGGPIAQCLASRGALVTPCDKATTDIPAITREADIVVVAAGSPRLVTPAYVRSGQVIIDVGINAVTGEGDHVSHTIGDVDFDSVSKIVSAISPVPGGVGPLTVASLFENLFDAFQHRRHLK